MGQKIYLIKVASRVSRTIDDLCRREGDYCFFGSLNLQDYLDHVLNPKSEAKDRRGKGWRRSSRLFVSVRSTLAHEVKVETVSRAAGWSKICASAFLIDTTSLLLLACGRLCRLIENIMDTNKLVDLFPY
jgi:hypothetical protein